MKKIILLLCVMVGSVCLTGTIHSENQTSAVSDCKITVVDENGSAIDRVLIQVQNSSISERTNTSGIATISCEGNATFILSHSDYETTEVSRNDASELTIVMPLSSSE